MTARSRRSYLIAAIYEWALDTGYTPHLLVAADYPGVQLPTAYVQEGRIALNISPAAVQGFDATCDPLFFSARFGGRPFELVVPSGAVLAIYANENGEGVVFGETELPPDGPHGPGGDAGATEPSKPAGRPKLRVVK